MKSPKTVVIKEGWLLPIGHLGRLGDGLQGDSEIGNVAQDEGQRDRHCSLVPRPSHSK